MGKKKKYEIHNDAAEEIVKRIITYRVDDDLEKNFVVDCMLLLETVIAGTILFVIEADKEIDNEVINQTKLLELLFDCVQIRFKEIEARDKG